MPDLWFFGSQLGVAVAAFVGLVLTSVAIARDVAVRRLDAGVPGRALEQAARPLRMRAAAPLASEL